MLQTEAKDHQQISEKAGLENKCFLSFVLPRPSPRPRHPQLTQEVRRMWCPTVADNLGWLLICHGRRLLTVITEVLPNRLGHQVLSSQLAPWEPSPRHSPRAPVLMAPLCPAKLLLSILLSLYPAAGFTHRAHVCLLIETCLQQESNFKNVLSLS